VTATEIVQEISVAEAKQRFPDTPVGDKKKPPVREEPSWERLQEMAAGRNLDLPGNSFAREVEGKPVPSVEEGEALFFLICRKRFHDPQTDYWTECSLPDGHPGRCKFNGRRISIYDDEGASA
jgi:hypothetical protein